MMLRFALLMCVVVLCVPVLYAQDDPCAGLVTPRLRAGETARVRFNDGVGVVLRDLPGKNESGSTILENLPEGVIFTPLGEAPICKDGFLWWFARLPDGTEGFIAEGAQAYFAEPWEVGAYLWRQKGPQLERFWVDIRGNVAAHTPFTLTPQSGTLDELWQENEIRVAEQAQADRQSACPDSFIEGWRDPIFEDSDSIQFFPSHDGQQVLVLRHYLLDIPFCAGQSRFYGTSHVSLVTAAGEVPIFPFSQHSDPPSSQYCQPQSGLEQITRVNEVLWSQDAKYVALSVRYLRNSENFPCAFYHIFLIQTSSLQVSYIGEGQGLGWGQGGRRLRYFQHQRTNPNEAGTEKLWSILPDGSDRLEIFLPGGATYLPDALSLVDFNLPWTEQGDKVLACNGRVYSCGETLTLRVIDSGFAETAIIAPAQLGGDLAGVWYAAGDTQLLWLNTAGKLFIQTLRGTWTELSLAEAIVDVIPLPTGSAALLEVADGRYFFLDVLHKEARQVENLP